MYSADLWGRKIWTHAIERATGKLTYVADDKNSMEKPKVIINVHPNGKFAYAILEDTNEVVEYTINNSTGAAKYTGKAYSVVPNSKLFGLCYGRNVCDTHLFPCS